MHTNQAGLKSHLLGTCDNTQKLSLASEITSLLIDVLVLRTPPPLLWKKSNYRLKFGPYSP
jgi:hypothetical protein